LPEREVVLLEAERRKCTFLEAWAPPNARVVWGRAEEQELDWAGVAVAKALAQPPTALEWCLPLVRPGGAVVLWVGPSADAARVARVAARLAGELDDSPPGFLVVRKIGPTPPGFPRRTGVARKRPLA
jgi:16S rRNA (guanine527-N7)-methyltransferase